MEADYLSSDDPIRQSGFAGGAERWQAERRPILRAVLGDGEFLDVGCANGYLLESLVLWGRQEGRVLTPHGVDVGPRLIEIAQRRQPTHARNFHRADIRQWSPPRRYDYVYMVIDIVPEQELRLVVRRIRDDFLSPGGTLILGAYGSLTRSQAAADPSRFLRDGSAEVGEACVGDLPHVRFAWARFRKA